MENEAINNMVSRSRLFNISIYLILLILCMQMMLGVIYAVKGSFMPYHITFTGISEIDVYNFNPQLMKLISVFIRLLGITSICFSVTASIIVWFGMRKKARWAWFVCLFNTIGFSVPFTILTYSIVGITGLPFILIAFCTVTLIVTLVSSFRELFCSQNIPTAVSESNNE